MNLAKSLKNTKTRTALSVGSAAFGVSSAVRDIKKAKSTSDKLALLDAVLTLAAVITGVALVIRALREGDE